MTEKQLGLAFDRPRVRTAARVLPRPALVGASQEEREFGEILFRLLEDVARPLEGMAEALGLRQLEGVLLPTDQEELKRRFRVWVDSNPTLALCGRVLKIARILTTHRSSHFGVKHLKGWYDSETRNLHPQVTRRPH